MRRFLFLIIIVSMLLVPVVANAALFQGPIVQCGRSDQVPPRPCSPCDLFETFHNLIDFVLQDVTGPVAAALIVVAGGMMLLSGGNAARFSQGKTMLTNTLIGVAIILLSWVFVNFLIKSLATGDQSNTWYQFSCPVGLSKIVNIETTFPSVTPPATVTPNIAGIKAAFCTASNLSLIYGVPNNETLNAPSLTKLMSCVESDSIVKALYDPGNKYTYEITNKLCNLDRGNPVCGTCAHAVNSCHYGGSVGAQGAMAVDYNAKAGASVTYIIASRTIVPSTADSRCNPPGTTSGALCRTVTGSAGLFDEIYRASQIKNCQPKFIFYEYTSPGRYHIHMSTTDCANDGAGTKGRVIPPLP